MSTTTTAPSSSAVANDAPGRHAWEDTTGQTSAWSVQEDEEGNLILGSSYNRAEAIRQRRNTQLHEGDYSQKRRGRIVRDLIRHLYIIVDASRWMQEKDETLGKGTRLELVLRVLQQFVVEYFDQNPLSHLGLILLRNGQAEMLTRLSSNVKTHKLALESLLKSGGGAAAGECSLQNGLELAGRSLAHLPKFASREIVVIMGALSTCDPTSNLLSSTLPKLISSRVRVSALALAAELYVCRKICLDTGGILGVCLNGTLLRDWLLLGQVVPPPALKKKLSQNQNCEFVLIGFPTRHVNYSIPTLVHATHTSKLLTDTAYSCPQCQARVLELPTDCAVCGLKLVLAPHLARSFHHLFPVPAFEEVKDDKENEETATTVSSSTSKSTMPAKKDATPLDSNIVTKSSQDNNNACFACLKRLSSNQDDKEDHQQQELKFKCPNCQQVFCADCDAYLHETLHNCPGCLL